MSGSGGIASTIRELVLYSGVTDSDGDRSGNYLVCSKLIGVSDFLSGKSIVLPLGNFNIKLFDPTTGIITLDPSYGQKILSNTQFSIAGLGGTNLGGTVVDSGYATAGALTTLSDTTKSWASNIWSSYILKVVHQGITYVRTINSNTPNQLVFDTLAVAIAAGDPYFICGSSNSWSPADPVVLYNAMPVGVGTVYSTFFDFGSVKRAMIKFDSTLDQAVNVQLLLNGVDVIASAVADGAPQNIAIGSVTPQALAIGIGINDDWSRYLAISITTAIACAAGLLTITVYSQK
jgi:hypothetical protein